VRRDFGGEGDIFGRLREGPAVGLLGEFSSSASSRSSTSSSLKVVNVRWRRGCRETGLSKMRAYQIIEHIPCVVVRSNDFTNSLGQSWRSTTIFSSQGKIPSHHLRPRLLHLALQATGMGVRSRWVGKLHPRLRCNTRNVRFW
jgi:hypothetical protein